MNALQFLAEWAIRSSILIASGAALLWLLRVKDSAIRLAAWTAMLAGSLLIPLVSITLPKVTVPVIRTQPEVPLMTYPAPQDSAIMPPVHASPAAPSRVPGTSLNWPRAALALYGLVASWMLLRLGAGLIGSLRLLKRSHMIAGTDQRESELIAAPVTLGVLRPKIVLPLDWREWPSSKLDAVLAHERSHIRRHDPLIQALSAIHRATLWFSPLSWLLHSRLVQLAEEASDDSAVRQTASDRVFYAELLLDFMQRPALKHSAAGVPMARYGQPHKRIDRILDAAVSPRGVTRWSVAVILILGMPLTYLVASARTEDAVPLPMPRIFAQTIPSVPSLLAQVEVPPKPAPEVTPIPKPKFEVASIKPCNDDSPGPGGRGRGESGRLRLRCTTAMQLIRDAYIRFANGEDRSPLLTALTKVEGAPGWLTTDQYTIEVEAEGDPKPSVVIGPMMQSLLEDRFQLKVHRETREGPVYDLVVAKGGSKIQPAKGTPCTAADRADLPVPERLPPGAAADIAAAMAADTRPCRLILSTRKGPNMVLRARGLSMAELISSFTAYTDRLVIDKTGAMGNVDLDLVFSPDDSTPGVPQPPSADAIPVANDPAGPDFATALQDQLGLKLQAAKGAREYLVIDSISRPTPN